MNENKGNLKALLPIAVFLVLYIGGGIALGSFYTLPTVFVFLVALMVAFLQNKRLSFNEKIHVIAQGLADDNIITMCLVFLAAGAFSGIVKAAGGADSTVYLALNFLPAQFAVAGLFLIGCFISLAMGTSVGTITVLMPFAVGISNTTGFDLVLCIAACASGAMFGDNLSMISDTTIAAVRTQGCQMKDKFKMNFLIVLPAAIITTILFFILTPSGNAGAMDVPPVSLAMVVQVLPYLLVLVGALFGINIFLLLGFGVVASAIVGIATGQFVFADIFGHMFSGIEGMYDITVISIIVCCIGSLMKEAGGFQALINFVRSKVKSKKGAQAGIAALVSAVDVATANNTISIVMTGSLAKEISDEYEIDPRRTASLLDIFSSVVQGLLPYGAQLLYAAAGATALLSGGAAVSSMEIVPYMFYPMLMAVSAIVFIIIGKDKVKK
ncbi:MAG: Na+/H+ antiporter NhaC family protein [Firmicutes bacterium]|nr:Na+/H+ antiporter NhaC family protein [Bacillota bacterium]